MNILTLTTLFPNPTVPHHGIFVERRLQQLMAGSTITSKVIAPVPWFPFSNPVFGAYSRYALVPRHETRSGVQVDHPRYPLIPKVGMTLSPLLMAISLLPRLRRFRHEFEVIDAHYFYPDGVAAVLLGKWLGKPVVITARGTDVNLIPKYRLPRKWILWAAARCHQVITVSDALREQLIDLGVAASKVRTLRNGVNLDFFRPLEDRSSIRQALEIEGFTLLSVGHLIERKGHHLVIEALQDLPDVNLVIAGSGSMLDELQTLATAKGVADRVSFTGALVQEDLLRYYNAADALVLASSREGMANVLLETIACGTPAVATPLWGNPEVIATDVAGQLTSERSPKAIATAVRRLRAAYPNRADTRIYAEGFGWQPTTEGQVEIFDRIRESTA